MEQPFWSLSVEDALRVVKSRREGLSAREARARLRVYGPNSIHLQKRAKNLRLFFAQFKSPLILLLIAAATLSYSLGGRLDASLILVIVVFSALLGFFQERGAIHSLDKLLKLIATKATVLREKREEKIIAEGVVPGDIVSLATGDCVPADCLLLEAQHLFVDEGTLTGESTPAEKNPGPVKAEASLAERSGVLFMGTTIVSGKAVALVVATGKKTEFGAIAERMQIYTPETAFEVGVKKFGYLLMVVTVAIVSAIFGLNLLLHRPILETLLFSLAIAVGLTPQLLPAIISVNLSHGARKMAKKKVIVKRLASIENFGQMNVLCADKTGTVTEGKMQFAKAVDPLGGESEKAKLYAVLNAHFQQGYQNPLDQAIVEAVKIDLSSWEKIDEIPYDFTRKRLSVIVRKENTVLICKGATAQILSQCSEIEWKGGDIEPLTDARREEIWKYFEQCTAEGLRILAIAYGETAEEQNLRLLGFLHFFDPLKEGIGQTVEQLRKKGVHLKILTGDHRLAALRIAEPLGLKSAHIITGEELKHVSDLEKIVKEKNIFSEVDPQQKEQIILALRKAGFVVGYLGDGINDVSALHSADIGISVHPGSDAAKEAADFVMLDKSLATLQEGIEEGRKTFANTIKYIYMATSANFGNMFSMAGASLFLNFLPLLPKQVLLTNLLTDFPEMAIASDRVDEDLVHRPVKWDLKRICRFMIVFGLISSIFDYITFGVLLWVFQASEEMFRTGWFVESVISAVLVALLIRTRKWFFLSKPGALLLCAIFFIVAFVSILPYTSLGALFGFAPLPLWFYGSLLAIIASYLCIVEFAKRLFFRNP